MTEGSPHSGGTSAGSWRCQDCGVSQPGQPHTAGCAGKGSLSGTGGRGVMAIMPPFGRSLADIDRRLSSLRRQFGRAVARGDLPAARRWAARMDAELDARSDAMVLEELAAGEKPGDD
ncbi:MAG TPA: hypothetical protein VKV80_09570 [Streptosporangiaceae bacterium]|nr:hypothetical protein [Streptosporangiaceae bacterium]